MYVYINRSDQRCFVLSLCRSDVDWIPIWTRSQLSISRWLTKRESSRKEDDFYCEKKRGTIWNGMTDTVIGRVIPHTFHLKMTHLKKKHRMSRPRKNSDWKERNASVITFTWTFPMNRSVIPFSYFVALDKCGTIDLVQSSCLDGKKSRWFSSLERFCNAQDTHMIVQYTPKVTLYAANDRKKSGANCGSISNCWLFPSGNRDWKVISYKLARGKGENGTEHIFGVERERVQPNKAQQALKSPWCRYWLLQSRLTESQWLFRKTTMIFEQ